MPTLTWIGKEKVINHHRDVPFHLLERRYGFSAEEGESALPAGSGNKIIHGDNLLALKSLLPEYEGKIKCIYIDPPYNTGNENWVYNDNVNDPRIRKWLGDVVGKEGDDLSRHDKWLCMMYPRLQLLYKLLSKNGILVLSIGYHEFYNIILVLKELFANKQIVCVTVQTSGGKPSGGFNYQHEYLIFVVPIDFDPNPLLFTGGNARTPFEGLTLATFNKIQRPNQTYPLFINESNNALIGVGESLHERIKKGTYQGKVEDFKFDYTEALPGTVAVWPYTSKGQECVWRLIPSRLMSDWEKGYIKVSHNKSKNNPNKYSIQYLPEGVLKKISKGELDILQNKDELPTLSFGENKTVGGEVPTIWIEKEFFTVKGTTLLREIFNNKEFNYPKPLELVTEVLRASCSNDDIVLDSFAGSGTTAHAVLNLNRQDGGNRKFILVEMEDYADSITAERVKRVIRGYGNTEGTGGSFDYFELGIPLFTGDNGEFLNEEAGAGKIREYIWYSETRTSYAAPETGADCPAFLGKLEGTAWYFFYEKGEITTLDYDLLSTVKTRAGQYVMYADNCLLPKEFMLEKNIIFKKIPRDITRF